MAEENATVTTESTQATENTTESTATDTSTAAEQPTGISEAEYLKMKATADKNAREAAEFKRKYNAKLTEDERQAAEKAAADAAMRDELDTLKKQAAVSEYASRAIGFGMDEKQAKEFSSGLYGSSDVEGVFAVLDLFKLGLEKSIEIKLMQTNPRPASGNQDVPSVTREQFLSMTYPQRVDLYNKDPETYAKLNGGK